MQSNYVLTIAETYTTIGNDNEWQSKRYISNNIHIQNSYLYHTRNTGKETFIDIWIIT